MGKAWFRNGPSSSFSKWSKVPSAGFQPPLVVGSGHERALMPLLVLLLVRAVGGAFASVLVPLCLALGVVKNRADRLLARGVAGGDVEELLGGSRALTSSTMRVVAMASLLPRITMGTPTCIEGVARITVEAETFMHRDRGVRPVALLRLVD